MIGTYTDLIASLIAFLVTHSIPAIRPVRARCVAIAGERAYLIAYSVVSVVVIAWMVSAALAAPYLELWSMTETAMWATAALMLPAIAFLVFGLTTPNPLSIPVKVDAYDPDQPGLLALTRHPVLVSFILWAISHIVANGTVSALLLFGFAAAFSVGGMFIVDARRKRTWGIEKWTANAAGTALLSWRFDAVPVADRRWILVFVLYALALWLHPIVIGVQPLPI